MNIVQLHDRVRFWIDTVASARFESSDIDQAINNAVREIADEKYDHSRLNHHGDTFQKTQRIRDELSNLVKSERWSSDGLNNTDIAYSDGSALIGSFPDDYKYLLSLAMTYGGVKYDCFPLTYDRKNIIIKNPFRRIQSGPSPKLYFIESELGITVYHPFGSVQAYPINIDYLADPVDVFYGYEKGPSDTIGLNTDFICSLSPTDYDGTEYVTGTELTTDGVTDVITYGLAVVDFVNPDINGFLHEEVARKAAMGCLLSSGNLEKYKVLKAEILAT